MRKIVVIGSINADLVIYSNRFPKIGETIIGNEFFMTQGGKGANQAVASKKSGGDTTFIGRVGKDFFGEFALSELNRYGVNTKVMADPYSQTGIALINVDRRGHNKITILPGANEKIGKDEVNILYDDLKKGDFLLLQGEIPIKTLMEVARYGRKIGATVILDPAPFKKELKKVFPYVKFLTPNELELKQIEKYENIQKLMDSDISLIIKSGAKGVLLRKKDLKISIPAFSVKAVDTTGAGDTFNGSFAAALSLGMNVRDALVFASAASAISVTRKGAAISMPERKEIENFLKSN